MKQKDITLFAIVAIISAVFSVLISGVVIPSSEKNQQAEVVDLISSEFIVPEKDSKYFNDKSNNPTKLIQIGDNTNTTPFNGSAN